MVGELAGGMTSEEIVWKYRVTEEDIAAALEYASELIEQPRHASFQATA
jgi:uncharacterized protein (DUF433 family)